MSDKLVQQVDQAIRKQGDLARLTLADYALRAAQILQELAAAGDSDRIKLQAAIAILDRIGVVPGATEPPQDEGEQKTVVREEAERTLANIRKNAVVQGARDSAKERSIETLMILEDEGDALPPASTDDVPPV